MTLLSVDNLALTRRGQAVLQPLSFTLRRGEFVGLLGPNGAGKTTLLRALLGLLPHQGQSSLMELSPQERARQAAFLPQSRDVAWPMAVRDLVGLGRIPWGGRDPEGDGRAVRGALERLGLQDLALRRADALSGGELARVLIARLVAQGAPLLLADEPGASLDPARQLETMALFAELAREGQGVLASLHDLSLAARYCSRVIVLDQGRLVADGPPGEVLRDDLLAEVFGLQVWRGSSDSGAPLLMPLASLR